MIKLAAPSLALTLEANALDFLVDGLERFRQRCKATDLKYAILQVSQAIELFLKARLAKEHPLLVFKDPAKSGADLPTVGVSDALRRLQAAGVSLTARDTSDVVALSHLRNRLLHSEIKVLQEDAEASVGRALSFLERFLQAELSLAVADHVSEEALFIGRKAGEAYDGALKLAQDRLDKALAELRPQQAEAVRLVSCFLCGQPMAIYPTPDAVPRNQARCYFCDEWNRVTTCKSCGALTTFGDTCECCP